MPTILSVYIFSPCFQIFFTYYLQRCASAELDCCNLLLNISLSLTLCFIFNNIISFHLLYLIPCFPALFKNTPSGPGKVAQQLRVAGALPEDLSLVHAEFMHLSSRRLGGSQPPVATPGDPLNFSIISCSLHRQECMWINVHTHKQN